MSADATGLLLIFIVAVITIFNIRRPNVLLAIGGAGAWLALMVYLVNNPPAGMTAGSAVHEILILVLSGVAIAVLLSGIQRSRGREIEGESEERTSPRSDNKRDYTERIREVRQSRHSPNTSFAESEEEYQARIHRILHPKRRI